MEDKTVFRILIQSQRDGERPGKCKKLFQNCILLDREITESVYPDTGIRYPFGMRNQFAQPVQDLVGIVKILLDKPVVDFKNRGQITEFVAQRPVRTVGQRVQTIGTDP